MHVNNMSFFAQFQASRLLRKTDLKSRLFIYLLIFVVVAVVSKSFVDDNSISAINRNRYHPVDN